MLEHIPYVISIGRSAGTIIRMWASATHYVSSTSLLENAVVALDGELRSLSSVTVDESMWRENAIYIEVRDATGLFLHRLLSLCLRPFMEDVKRIERVVIIK